MGRLIKSGAHIWLSLLVLTLAVFIRYEEPTLIEEFRNRVFDSYQRWRPREYQPGPVRIVDINDETLERLGQWPWPRTRVAELVNRLDEMGAAVIVFDVLFAEPDRTSPSELARLLEPSSDLSLAIEQLPDNDAALADAIGKAKVVTAFALTTRDVEYAPASKAGYSIVGADALPYLIPFTEAIPTLPIFEDVAQGNGAISFPTDTDGVVRRVPLLIRKDETLYPTLSLEALRVALGETTITVASTNRKAGPSVEGIEEVRLGRLSIPTDRNGRMWIHFTGPVPERQIPAWKILADDVPDDEVRGAIVIVGGSAAALFDVRATPLHPAAAGVMVHAQIVEQMLEQSWLRRPNWASALEVIFMISLRLVVIMLSVWLGAFWTAIIGAVAFAMATGFSMYVYVDFKLLLDPIYPSLMVGAVYSMSSLVRHIQSERQRKLVEQVFSSHVSPNLVQHFIHNPDSMAMRGERRECSFVLTDLAGFTSFVEKSDPEILLDVIDDYIDGMTRVTFEHDGTLDRITGDAVAVMFSAPIVQPDHARRAIECALAMDAFSEEFRARKATNGSPPGHTRIGVHTGTVIIGNVGGEYHSDYRALGDAIITAARLESFNKHIGTRICVSGATMAQVPDFVGRPMGSLILKGKTQAIDAYEPLTRQDASSERVTSYIKAFALLEDSNGAALTAFSRLHERYPDDPLVDFHLARLNNGESGQTITMAEK
ncbi:MAG: adenylate/guanylate cyclase domain-containing protein [Rhodospirillales bacterium]|nr:adenylate/guanylate cyclase domain-containing protein [Rhodospirillales bacterium]